MSASKKKPKQPTVILYVEVFYPDFAVNMPRTKVTKVPVRLFQRNIGKYCVGSKTFPSQ